MRSPPLVRFDPFPQPPIWTLRFYRSQPGDSGFRDIPLLDGWDEAEIPEVLLARFNDPKRGFKPPNQAEVLDAEGRVHVRFRVINREKVHRVIAGKVSNSHKAKRVPQHPA